MTRLSDIFAGTLDQFGAGADVCPTCLGPRHRAGWLLLRGDEQPAPCGECGLPVHTDGQSAVSPGENGRPVLRSIRLAGG
jgi:hypothetical protein